MVQASKRLSIHRNSNVLTISLKRFANFNGGKISKVGVSCKCFNGLGKLFILTDYCTVNKKKTLLL